MWWFEEPSHPAATFPSHTWMILSVVQHCGDSTNIDLRLHWTSKPQWETRCGARLWSESTQNLDVANCKVCVGSLIHSNTLWLHISILSTTVYLLHDLMFYRLVNIVLSINTIFISPYLHTYCSLFQCLLQCCFAIERLWFHESVKQSGQNELPLFFKVLFQYFSLWLLLFSLIFSQCLVQTTQFLTAAY